MNIRSLIKQFPDDASFLNAFVKSRFPQGVTCAHCHSHRTVKVTLKKYWCNECHNSFSILKGTLFENTKLDLQTWLIAILRVAINARKGVSSCELARELGVKQQTAWRMLHKIRTRMAEVNQIGALYGIVEVDETYVGGSPRKNNCKWINKKAGNKRPVVTMIERQTEISSGKVRATVMWPDEKGQSLTGEQLKTVIEKNVDSRSEVHTDQNPGYNDLENRGYLHEAVNHNQRYVSEDGHVHINTAESFHSGIKRMHYGVYHWFSDKWIQNYMEEAAFRWNHRKEAAEDVFRVLVGV